MNNKKVKENHITAKLEHSLSSGLGSYLGAGKQVGPTMNQNI